MRAASVRPVRTGEVGPRLIVTMRGEPIGVLESPSGTSVRLTYSANAAAVTRGLSCSLPVSTRRHSGQAVANWIGGLLPDRSEVLSRWRAKYGVKRQDTYALLWHVGEDVAGAASFVRPDRLDALGEGEPQELTEVEIGARISMLLADSTAWAPSTARGQFSLAGAQAKFALARTASGWILPAGDRPTTHIFKPAIVNLADQDLNEHLTMRLAAAVGLPVAPTELVEFDGQRVLVVTRFDRVQGDDGTWRRVHQEDAVQAQGLSPTRKYETDGGRDVQAITRLLRANVTGGHQSLDIDTFIGAVAFNWLVVGTDAHARNYALMHTRTATRLAPLYDLNSYLPYAAGRPVTLAMKVGFSERDPSLVGRRDWDELARDCDLDVDEVLTVVRSMADRLADVAADTIRGSSGPWASDLPEVLTRALLAHVRLSRARL